MTSKNWTLEGKNRILGGKGAKMTPKNRTSFMDGPLSFCPLFHRQMRQVPKKPRFFDAIHCQEYL